MTKRIFWIGAIIFCVGAICAAWLLWPRSVTVASAHEAPNAEQSVVTTELETLPEPTTAPVTDPASSSAPITPAPANSPQQVRQDPAPLKAGTGLVDRLDQLVQQANAGDVMAACQLGTELEDCSQLGPRRKQIEENEARIPNGGGWVGAMRAEFSKLEQSCGSLVATAALEAPLWQLRAALGGNQYAKSRYASNTSYLQRAAIERPELVRLYVENAPNFWREEIAMGNSDALLQMASVLVSSEHPSGQTAQGTLRWALTPDPALARTYMQTFAREQQIFLQNNPLSTRSEKYARQMISRNAQSYAVGRKGELDQFDVGLSPQQIEASNRQAEALVRERAPARVARAAREAREIAIKRAAWSSGMPSSEELCTPAKD